MATTIVTKSGSGAPTASDLVAGELAVDLTNGRLYTEDSGGTVLELGLNPNGNVNVTGSVTADGLTVDGRTDLRGGATPLGVYRTLALAVDTQAEIVLGSQDLSNNYVDAAKIRGLLKSNKTDGELSFYTLSSSTLTPRLNIASNGDLSLYEDTGTTPKFFWDASAEALGIGTSSPTAPLTVNGTNAGIRFTDAGQDPTNYYGEIYKDYQGNAPFVIQSKSSGIGVIALNPDGGNVGIGIASPTHPLQISGGASDGRMSFTNNARGNGQGDGMWVGVDNTQSYLLSRGAFPLSFYTNATERMRLDASGNLLVGTTTASLATASGSVLYGAGSVKFSNDGLAIEANRHSSDGEVIRLTRNGTDVGSIDVTTSATTYNTSSDQRLKENIADADDAGSKVDAIQVRKFDWKVDGSHQDYGMVAQELLEVAPEAVSAPEDPEEMMGVDYSKLVPMMLKEIQSLRARVAQLES